MARGSRYYYGDSSFQANEFEGLTNRTPVFIGDWKRLRQAINVDLTREKKLRRRSGRTSVYTGAALHSLWGTRRFGYFVEGTTLKRFSKEDPGNPVTLRTGLSAADMEFVELHGDVFYANGAQSGCLLNGVTDAPWWVQTPQSQLVAAAQSTGGLKAGDYRVTLTYVDAMGRESAALPGVSVTVPEVGGIALSAIPVPTEAAVTSKRVYLSVPADETFYAVATLAAGATTVTIGAGARAQPLRTQYLDLLPPGEHLEHYAGRLWASQGPYLYFSEALHYGLCNLRASFFAFPEDITALGAVEGSGLYVLAGKTYFLAGTTPEEMQQQPVREYSGPWQRMVKVPVSALKGASGPALIPVWMSERGMHAGLPGGQVLDLTEPEVVLPRYQRSAALYREERGVKQLVAVGRGGASASLAIADTVVAEIRRNGVIIT